MKIRTLIVDDEPLARERLSKLLEQEEDIAVVGQAASGLEALKAIQELAPALVFLDVQMPELDGFGVLARLTTEPKPAVIFVTAHDQFALRAFEVHAVDYLLKPFDRERFHIALRRALNHIRSQTSGELGQRLSDLLSDLRPEPKAAARLAVKSGGKVLFLKIEEIDWIEAADNYVNLHTGSESHLHRETLTSLESQLPSEKFLRISRSTIVQVDRIKELHPLFHGEYTVVLRNGARLTLSRSYREKLHQLLGKIP